MIRAVVGGSRVQDGDLNSTSVTRTFDGADRVTKVVYGFSGGGWPVTYTRGPAGELVGASQWGGTNTWAYDPAQQVTATTNPTNTYGFDTTGNPTTLNTTAQAFDPSGELCWTGPTSGTCGNPPADSMTYDYDTNGQRTSAGASSFSYDGTGQMQSATTPTGTSTYTYAPDGLRTSKTVGGVTTDFAWDDTTPVPELIQDGDNYYIYGPDGLPVERIGADPTRWLMCDATGSVTVTTDGSASITSVQGYDPWGNPTVTTGTPVSLGWQHQYRDTETGYYNLWHRYYDPTTAQFTTPDPLFALTGDRYGYAGNDPVNGSDPTGLSWINPCIGDTCASDVVKEGFTHVVNGASGVDFVALVYGEITSGGHCYPRGGRIECDGAWGYGGRQWTFGDVVMNTSSSRMSDERFGHESKHSTQWAAFGGWGFIPAYGLDLLIEGRCNSFEHEAGYTSGGYNDPPNPCQPGRQRSSSCSAGGHYSTDPH